MNAPLLQKLGVDVIGIDQQEDSAQVERFSREFALNYPIYVDVGTVTHDLLGARIIPAMYFVDASGVIRWQHSGPLNSQDFRNLASLAETTK